mmetsp:Transcript_20879/g.37335  ORF Transcript_20879/g.37335 Transcript_20879/m.37335 type:complete len:593 (-) Transcript_20879:688-2466(-)|eukprot:CAMPEP_0175050850 /NCGR_PEP_ID=MMETSP0052_2-20121109/7476_1 /TAXON_ID=51329 ORGANISM="Polytomella parva, Strain SAG 63-3" /NCGR_SAMPLE_ID=MMETSP0052_2 /ASSEMBLY_ACC=CAM_ASM_000194 /LENGTH=592 /DNA_ID=CAMNT_0016315075 /DNA_START=180 /DNA_END=1958 /DNA_ORIENTATION=-
MSDCQSLLSIGDRIIIQGYIATVRYVGEVEGQKGVWVGVEWDDPSRGKHDGCTGGKRYFSCISTSPTAGSFVRFERVQKGLSVSDALQARYNNQMAEFGVETTGEELYVHTIRQQRVHVELVGAEKISRRQAQLEALVTARLVGMGIDKVGDAKWLSESVPNLEILDLSCNLFSSVSNIWVLFSGLCHSLPELQVLILSDNRIGPLLPDPIPNPSLAVGLRALVLNRTGITWLEVLALAPGLPNLAELHLDANGLETLSLDRGTAKTANAVSAEDTKDVDVKAAAPLLRSLEMLSLEKNGIRDWISTVNEIHRHAPHLKRLHLGENPLESLSFPSWNEADQDHSEASQVLGSLECLLLGNCQIQRWSDVDCLAVLRNLRDLRLSGNPVLSKAPSGGRFQVIARLPQLTCLNAAEVRPRERRDSELRYLQMIGMEMETALRAFKRSGGGVSEDPKTLENQEKEVLDSVLARHPRAKELQAVHGPIVLSKSGESAGADASSISSSLVELKITCVSASASAKMGSNTKRLPRGMTLSALKMLCEKLFKVRVSKQIIYLKDPNVPLPDRIPESEDQNSLAYLGVQDNFEILVDESE